MMDIQTHRGLEQPKDAYGYDFLKADKQLLEYYKSALTNELCEKDKARLESTLAQLSSEEGDRLVVRYSDVLFLHKCLNSSGSTEQKGSAKVPLYKLMLLTVLELPSPALPEQTEEYNRKMERLRLLAAEADYQRMTKNVGAQGFKQESIGKELRQMDSQVTFLFNFFLTVVGAFVFGYKAVEYTLETPNLSLQLTVAVTLATLVFFADVYFIIKEYV